MSKYLNTYIGSMENIDGLTNSMESIIKDGGVISGLFLALEVKSLAYDANKEKGTLSNEDINGVKQAINNINLFLGETPSSISHEDMTLSLEELEAEKKSMLDRFTKYLTNTGDKLATTIEDIADQFKKLDMSSLSNLMELKQELKSGARKFNKTSIEDTGILKDLAIYFSMYSDFKPASFGEFMNIPTELVDGGVVDFVIKHGYDNIVVSNDNAADIPKDPVSLKVIDRIHVKNVRDWLSKDTKFAMVDRLQGDRLGVISLYQDRQETDARQDRFTIPASVYTNKSITLSSDADLLKLIEVCEKASKDFTKNMEEIKKLKWDTLKKNTRSALASGGYMYLFGPFALRRYLRNLNAAETLANGIVMADAKLVRSQLALMKTVYNIIKASTTVGK